MNKPEERRRWEEIPGHEHSHSLYVHCLDCHTWGVNLPTKFIEAAQCGNCGSMYTVKYFPACCILADRGVSLQQLEAAMGGEE